MPRTIERHSVMMMAVSYHDAPQHLEEQLAELKAHQIEPQQSTEK